MTDKDCDFVKEINRINFTKFVNELGFRNPKLTISPASKKGDNYLGSLFRVTVEEESDRNGKSYNLVVKVPVKDEIRDFMSVRNFFLREIYAYTVVLPKFEEIQRSASVPQKGRLNFVKCYKAIDRDLEEMVIMKDIKSEGYLMFDRHEPLTFEHVSLAMRTIAKLHGLSFVLKHQYPEQFKEFASKIPDVMFGEGYLKDHLKEFMTRCIDLAVKHIDDISVAERVLAFGETYISKMQQFVKPGSTSILCHGDCWNNNLLYRYEGGVPVEARLLDYQLMRYASPVTDIMYFIFCSVETKLRRDHYQEFLDIYHKSLGEYLKYYSLDVERVYSRAHLDRDLNQHGGFGLGMALVVLVFFTSSAEDAIDFDEMAKESFDFARVGKCSTEIYEERMRSVVEDSIKLGYL